MDIEALNRMYYCDKPQKQEGMPRLLEIAVQKFLEPIIDEIFQDQDVETSLKLLSTLVNLSHTVYVMGKRDGSCNSEAKPTP